MRAREFPDQPALAHARLPHQRHDLAASCGGLVKRPQKDLELSITPDELCEASRGGRVETRACRTPGEQLVDLDGLTDTLHLARSERLDLHIALGQPQRVGREQYRAGQRQLLYPGRQMG